MEKSKDIVCCICGVPLSEKSRKTADGHICESCAQKSGFKDYVVYEYLTTEDILEQINEPNEKFADELYSKRSSAAESRKKRKVKIIWISILVFVLAVYTTWRLTNYFEPGNMAMRKVSSELTTNFPYTEKALHDRKIQIRSRDNGSGDLAGTGIEISFGNLITKEQYIEISNYFFDVLQYQQENRSAINWLSCSFTYPDDEIEFKYICRVEEFETDAASNVKALISAQSNTSKVKLYRISGEYKATFIPIDLGDIDGYIEYTCVNMVDGYSLEAPKNIAIVEITQPEKSSLDSQDKENESISYAVTLGDDLNWDELNFEEKIQVVNWVHKQQTQFTTDDDALSEFSVVTVYDSLGSELFTMTSNAEYIKNLQMNSKDKEYYIGILG